MNGGNSDHQSLVYHRDRLRDLKTGINKVLDIIYGVLCLETCTDHEGNPQKLADYYASLQRVENESWGRLKEEFIEKNKTWDGNDDVIADNKTVSQILLEFVKKLDELKSGLEDKYKIYAKRESVLVNEVKTLSAQLAAEQQDKLDLKWEIQELTGDTEGSKYSSVFLQQQLKEKQDKIAQLQRNSTVQLWEKERNRIMETSVRKEKELAEQLESLKKTHKDTKERLLAKVKELEGKSKMEKMKSEITQKTLPDDNQRRVDDLNRKLLISERDLKKAEEELLKQQKISVGCFTGLRIDFETIVGRQEENKFRTDDIRKLKTILSALVSGAKEGRLEITKADLPLHYMTLNEDLAAHPGNKKLSTNTTLHKSVNRHMDVIDKGPTVLPPCSSSPACLKKENIKIIDSTKHTRTRKATPQKTLRNGKPVATEKKKDENPKLIGKLEELDIETAMKCFPNMSEMELREHFEQYKRYDTDGNHTLDFSEMMRAMRSTVGDYYTPVQIKEAMTEIDVDGNDTIDFYEYLTISSMLFQRSGKAEIFNSHLVREAGTVVSRTCVVQ